MAMGRLVTVLWTDHDPSGFGRRNLLCAPDDLRQLAFAQIVSAPVGALPRDGRTQATRPSGCAAKMGGRFGDSGH
ncbi:MAG: hypothetical protein KF861_18265, partial [Planctomycetaceae bacterium]|nr:hypothetical protein [Planctomycetaceae bacterium]